MRKFYFSFLAFALALATTVALVVGHSTRAASANTALNALPASDFIVSVDVQRALNEMLPALLSNNPQLLAKVNSSLKEFEETTGISPHVFESVAVGGSLNPTAPPGRHDSSGVVILRGSFKSDELINAAFAAASKKCVFQKEEQQYEGKTIYLIGAIRSLKDESSAGKSSDSHPYMLPYDRFGYPRTNVNETGSVAAPDTSKTTKITSTEAQEKYSTRVGVSTSTSDRFAIAAIDANTIAVGSPESVRASIDASLGRNPVDDELVRLASQTPNAVVSFSGKIPQSMTAKSTQGGDNPVAKYFASVRAFYGSFAVNSTEAETNAAIRTETAQQASDISQAINALKGVANIGISQSSGKEMAAVSDVLKSLSITAQDNEVHIDFKISLTNLAPFIHAH